MKDSTTISHCINENGISTPLFSLWENRRVIICFARHMGCMFCKEQVAALEFSSDKLDNEIVSIVITVGRYNDIPKFRIETGFTGEIYVDSDLYNPTCYSRMKLNNGPSYLFESNINSDTNTVTDTNKDDNNQQTIRIETMKSAERATKNGFTNGGYPTLIGESIGSNISSGDDTGEGGGIGVSVSVSATKEESPYTGDVLQVYI